MKKIILALMALALVGCYTPESKKKSKDESATKQENSLARKDYVATDPIILKKTLQKKVQRYSTDEALASQDVPQEVKEFIKNSNSKVLEAKNKDGVTWKSNIFRKNDKEYYVVQRFNPNEKDKRDKVQDFTGEKYLYDLSEVIGIFSDDQHGVWTVTKNKGVTHIEMKEMSYSEKAREMDKFTQDNIARRGMISEATIHEDGKYHGDIDDNDGLWTAMYVMGELYRYASETDPVQKEIARKNATKSVEALLLLSNIASREGTIDYKVRAYKPDSNHMTTEFLKKGYKYEVNLFPDGPANFNGKYSPDAEKYNGGFTHPENWTKDLTQKAETKTGYLEGFIARSYVIKNYPNEKMTDGLYIGRKKDKNGKMQGIVVKDTKNYYQGFFSDKDGNLKNNTVGMKVSASREIPQRLRKLYSELINPNTGKKVTDEDLIYKADTSSDELIGHYAAYKLAYDILGPTDPELAELIKTTMVRHTTHLLKNDHSMIDLFGYPTSWGKLNNEYFMNNYAWEDCGTTSLVILTALKVTAYLTQDDKWEKEYRKLLYEKPYQYAKLIGEFRERWNIMIAKENGIEYKIGDTEAAKPGTQLFKLVQDNLSYSDEEMAMLAYYTLFQLETDPKILDDLHKGFDSWWVSGVQQSSTPLWLVTYQLAYPEKSLEDGRLLKDLAWSLKRHSIDMRPWIFDNSYRAIPLINDSNLAYSEETKGLYPFPMDEVQPCRYNNNQSQIISTHKSGLEPCTTYTLPYWMAVYHHLIKEETNN